MHAYSQIASILALMTSILGIAATLVQAKVVYVDADSMGSNDGTSWTDAYTDLQSALTTVKSGDEIWVAEGTYRPTGPKGDRTISFEIPDGVPVFGGFCGTEVSRDERDPETHLSTLSGDLNTNDGPDYEGYDENSYHVTSSSALDLGGILDGFTVTAGNANGDFPYDRGSALYLDGSVLDIASCVITKNTGLFASTYAVGSSLIIEASSISTNDGEGLRALQSGVIIHSSDINGNSTHGILNLASDLTVISSRIYDNGGAMTENGGGLLIVGPTTLIGCSLWANIASVGGAINNDYDGTQIIGCRFSGNSYPGVWNNGNDLDIINSTFVNDNLIACCGGVLTITNGVHWGYGSGTEEDQILLIDIPPPVLVINHSIVQGWTGMYGGIGNNGDDPMFADPDGPDGIPGTDDDDLRLMPGSPAIDSGDNNAVPPDSLDLEGDGDTIEPIPFDLDGNPRFRNDRATEDAGVPLKGDPSLPIVDRGGYELQPPCDGDANADNQVDPLDSGFVLARLGCAVGTGDPGCDSADQDGDGMVDPLDVGYVLARFGDCS